MSDYTQCPRCKSGALLDGLPRLHCGECDWHEGDELTRLRAREAVLVEALNHIAFEPLTSNMMANHSDCLDEVVRIARKALATISEE